MSHVPLHAHNLCRVLLIADGPQAMTFYEVLVDIWGHEFQTVIGTEAALEAATSFIPHVVLVDLGFEQKYDADLVGRLRKAVPDDSTKIIALIQLGRTDALDGLAAAGFDEQLVRPIEVARLKRAIDRSASTVAAA